MTPFELIIIIIVVQLLLCRLVGEVARNKGRSFFLWVVASVCVTPLVAGLMLLIWELNKGEQ